MATADRPDLELLAMLHVARPWTVHVLGASFPASTLALALRLAEVQRGRQLRHISSNDGRFHVSPQQIIRLWERLRAPYRGVP